MTGSKKNTRQTASNHTSWIQKFESSLNGQPLRALRQQAIADFDRLGYPTTADEAWKSVNPSALVRTDFEPATPATLADAELAPFIYPDLQGIRLVFVNGHYAPEHTSDIPEGITIANLADVYDHPLVKAHLGKLAQTTELAFTALNTAFMRDGVFIHVQRKCHSRSPRAYPLYHNSVRNPHNIASAQPDHRG